MPVLIGVVSQKGGVGKSTLARLIAREYAAAGWEVKLADLDTAQGTSTSWQSRRLRETLEPKISVEQFQTVTQSLRDQSQYDLLVFDGAPHSSQMTREIARVADILLLPTGLSVDDLEPTVLLANEIVERGTERQKLAFALCRVGDSDLELAEARCYVERAGYTLLAGAIPEKTAYRRASDTGRAVTETRFPSLNTKAEQLAQSIINLAEQRLALRGAA